MEIYLPYRFYKDASLLTKNKTNRDDANHPPALLVENDIIPAFQVAVPYTGGKATVTFKLIDDQGNETALAIGIYETVRIVEGATMRYITHLRQEISYDAGCYYSELSVDGTIFYGVKIQNLESTYTETFHRLIDSNNKRLYDESTTDKRSTKDG